MRVSHSLATPLPPISK
jgi:hypothetical protein